jgi:hypothetical protein
VETSGDDSDDSYYEDDPVEQEHRNVLNQQYTTLASQYPLTYLSDSSDSQPETREEKLARFSSMRRSKYGSKSLPGQPRVDRLICDDPSHPDWCSAHGHLRNKLESTEGSSSDDMSDYEDESMDDAIEESNDREGAITDQLSEHVDDNEDGSIDDHLSEKPEENEEAEANANKEKRKELIREKIAAERTRLSKMRSCRGALKTIVEEEIAKLE